MYKLILAFILFPVAVWGDVIAVSHPSATPSMDDVKKAWSGKGSYKPIDNTPLKNQFCDDLLGSPCSVVEKKLSRMVFSGRAAPPEVVSSDSEVINKISSNPKAIGYIHSESINSKVKKIN